MANTHAYKALSHLQQCWLLLSGYMVAVFLLMPTAAQAGGQRRLVVGAVNNNPLLSGSSLKLNSPLTKLKAA